MTVLDERVAQKRHIHEIYAKAFEDNPYISLAPTTKGSEPNYWLTAITLSCDCKATFMDILNALAEQNIESRPAWKPMHMQPVFKDCGFVTQLDEKQQKAIGAGSVCEDLFNRSLCLPCDTKMTDDQVRFVAGIVIKTIEDKQRA